MLASPVKSIFIYFMLLFSSRFIEGHLSDLGMIPEFNEIFELLTPYTINDYTKLRLGKDNDSGYVVPRELISQIDRCYTYGAGPDISFETDISTSNKLIKTYIYDHTVDYPSVIKENVFFKKEGIGAILQGQLNTLKNHLAENNDSGARFLLKLDIEGAEWDVLDSLEKEVLYNVPVLIIELHWLSTLADLLLYTRVLKKINEQFVPFHIHPNNCARFLSINGKVFADVLEVTYIHKKYVIDKVKQSELIADTNLTVNCLGVDTHTLNFWL